MKRRERKTICIELNIFVVVFILFYLFILLKEKAEFSIQTVGPHTKLNNHANMHKTGFIIRKKDQ